MTYNSNTGSKLDLKQIFNHGKQKLTIKKNDYSVQSGLVVLDHFISKILNGKGECIQVFDQRLQLPEIPLSTFSIHLNGQWEGISSLIEVKLAVKIDFLNFDILFWIAKNVNKSDFWVFLITFYEIVYC